MGQSTGGPSKHVTAGFIQSSAVVFAITGAAKVWSVFGGMRVLAATEPLTGLTFGRLLLVAGIVELMAAALCVMHGSALLRVCVVSWLAGSFAVYRIGLWTLGWHGPCPCLGNLTDALHISPATADNLMKGVLAYLLVGSYWLLWREWKNKTWAPLPSPRGGESVLSTSA